MNHTSVVYVENETKLWLIKQSTIYDKNKIGQWYD